MAASSKSMSDYDQNQIVRKVYNDSGTLSVDGFVAGAVGRKITETTSTTTNPDDTKTYHFYENVSTLLMTIVVIYTDNTYETLVSVQRTA